MIITDERVGTLETSVVAVWWTISVRLGGVVRRYSSAEIMRASMLSSGNDENNKMSALKSSGNKSSRSASRTLIAMNSGSDGGDTSTVSHMRQIWSSENISNKDIHHDVSREKCERGTSKHGEEPRNGIEVRHEILIAEVVRQLRVNIC